MHFTHLHTHRGDDGPGEPFRAVHVNEREADAARVVVHGRPVAPVESIEATVKRLSAVVLDLRDMVYFPRPFRVF